MLKTILSQVKEYKGVAILTPVCMIAEVIMEMIIPLLMAYIIDEGVMKGNQQAIVRVGGVMLIIALIGLIAGMLGGKYGALASSGLAKNLRNAMYENIQTYSFANLDKYSTAGLVTRLTTDVNNVQMAFQMFLRMCMRAPSSLIIAMVMAFSISAKLASVYLYVVIALSIFLALIIRKAMGYFQEVFQKYDDLNASVQENVNAIRVVKAYVREERENKKFSAAAEHVYKLFIRAEKMVVLNMPMMQVAVYTCMLLISWLGAKMIVVSELTTGELMSLIAYCMNILMSLMILSMIFVMMTMSAASAKRIAEVINEKSTLVSPADGKTEVKDGSIAFEHVSFEYNEGKPVLSDINVTIQAGETVGILGGTGSAKTSFVNLIPRLYDVAQGTVKVGGVDVRAYDLDTLRSEVSVVLQKNVLFSGTIYDNLRWGDENATEEMCRQACRLACADEFISKMPDGYHTQITQGGSNVSGGQKQRLCIARALLKKPKILILDDSTSAVDTATEAKIRQAFATEIPNTTKLIIAQRISSIQHADHIIVLEDGKINGYGTHDELLASNEIYREIFEAQTNGAGDFDEKEAL